MKNCKHYQSWNMQKRNNTTSIWMQGAKTKCKENWPTLGAKPRLWWGENKELFPWQWMRIQLSQRELFESIHRETSDLLKSVFYTFLIYIFICFLYKKFYKRLKVMASDVMTKDAVASHVMASHAMASQAMAWDVQHLFRSSLWLIITTTPR